MGLTVLLAVGCEDSPALSSLTRAVPLSPWRRLFPQILLNDLL